MNAARLLVVDDEAINLEIIAEYLEDEELELIMVMSGEEALAHLEAERAYDCVILDRMMPGLDGLEVLRRMQQDARLKSVPVIMQTAAAGHDQVADGLRLGAYYYLTKPYHRDSLVAVVNSALDVLRRRRELAREIDQYHGLLSLLEEGRFRVQTLRQAHALAAGLSTLGADPPGVALGLLELLINGIEHGNLGITFREKSELLATDSWEKEVQARLALTHNRDKYVQAVVQRDDNAIRIVIRDCGEGFDWRRYLELDESRALHPNGRGIAIARHVAFRTVEFIEPGNEVIVTFKTTS
jgi:CheY-like chemotaxis protein